MPGVPSGSSTPVKVYVSGSTTDIANTGAADDITKLVDLDTLAVEESGNHEQSTCTFNFIDGHANGADRALRYSAMRGGWKILVSYNGETIFRGYIRQPQTTPSTVYALKDITAYDLSSRLETLIIDVRNVKRAAGESDKARTQWLYDVFGQPLEAEGIKAGTAAAPSTGWPYLQVLNASMPAQTFKAPMTLKQGQERILGAASDSANYYLDATGRLHDYDDNNPETTAWTDAPYVINEGTPGAGEIAPSDLTLEWDFQVRNFLWANVGNKPALSGPYSDKDLLPGPWSIDLFGVYKGSIDVPDAQDINDVQRVVKAALRDLRNPIPRGSFWVSGSRCYSGSKRWQAGMLVYVKSTRLGLNGSGTDAGPWAGTRAPQPFRIVRNRTTFLSGGDERRMEMDFGFRRPHLFQYSGI